MALFRGRIVARPGINAQRREAFRRHKVHFDLVPLAIARRIRRTVAEDILVS